MSGRELADKLRSDNPMLPVIYSSGFSRELADRKARPHKSEVFLSKPYYPAELSAAVRNFLEKRGESTPPESG
jgi:CheY-like chemotaxis protein